MVFAHVIHVKTGLERKNVTVKAYQLIPKSYTLLGYVDENGNPVNGPEVQQKAVKTQKKSVEPAVKHKMTEEEKAAKMAELKAMNEAAIKKVTDDQKAREDAVAIATQIITEATNEVKERQKPGPKPKTV